MKTLCMVAGILFSFIVMGCQQDKIPFTTDSDIAREYLIKGLDQALTLRNQEAVENFQLALKHDPDFPMANYFMAAYAATPGERVSYFEKAKSVMNKASWGEQQYILALEAGMSGYAKKQTQLIQELCSKYPMDEGAKNLLGNIYFGQQDYQQAIETYMDVIRINPEYSQAYNQLGYCYRYLGDYVLAEKAFKKYIELIPDEPNPYDSYAELLLKMGEYEVSIENYEKALKIDPNFMNSYMGLSCNYNIKREYKTARKYLKEFYTRSMSQDQKRTAIGALILSFVDEGDLDGAMKWATLRYDDSVREGDTVLIAADLNTMGYLYRAKNQPEEVVRVFKQGQELIRQSIIPDNIKDNFKRFYPYIEAQIALMKNDFDLAKRKQIEFQAEIEKIENPNQVRLAHELSGQIALAEEKYSLAIEQLEKANQQNARNLYRIASAYEGMHDLEKALDYYERAANFNAFMDMEYALIRNDAEKKIVELHARRKSM